MIEEITFKCYVCRDTGFVPGPDIHRFGQVYTTAKPCDCLTHERLDAKLRARIAQDIAGPPAPKPVDSTPENDPTKSPRNFRQLGFMED